MHAYLWKLTKICILNGTLLHLSHFSSLCDAHLWLYKASKYNTATVGEGCHNWHLRKGVKQVYRAACSVVGNLLDLDPQGRWFDPWCGHDKICTAAQLLTPQWPEGGCLLLSLINCTSLWIKVAKCNVMSNRYKQIGEIRYKQVYTGVSRCNEVKIDRCNRYTQDLPWGCRWWPFPGPGICNPAPWSTYHTAAATSGAPGACDLHNVTATNLQSIYNLNKQPVICTMSQQGWQMRNQMPAPRW